ncbi:class II aldolase/adducin family protein [Oceaniglobus ichthyenteri]|uniref:class II aldolase/adducin family protein n=1 Tax=Oceaniglobus ichthyenteri TaxID=2136177 RepID=UPI000D3946C5|nr:class II aldolase/adducin family protein [Oceaniglobus ichthyenteri]
MNTEPELLSTEFRALSARLGQDPLQVQGPGGNTSIKSDRVMWVKASGTELADAEAADIFVPVDLAQARAQAHGAGDGSCKDTVIDPAITLRPSIETTFHAALDCTVVAHTHSVATLAHAISPQGREVLRRKLKGMPFESVPYAKPGLPLTQLILSKVTDETRIVILENHGLICMGNTVAEVAGTIAEVEKRLALSPVIPDTQTPHSPALSGYVWADESWIAQNPRTATLAVSGSYYPDHVVFLGAGLPQSASDPSTPVILIKGEGILIRSDATPSQRAMLRCLGDVLCRVPADWQIEPIGTEAEAALLNWDAEKYRQALAQRS